MAAHALTVPPGNPTSPEAARPKAGPPGPPARGALHDLLRPEDFQHRLRLVQGQSTDFFRPWDPSGTLLAQRNHWIDSHPERHLGFLPEAIPLLPQAEALLAPDLPLDSEDPPDSHGSSADAARWSALARRCEADLVLLLRSQEGPRLVAHAVCFPSSWRPEEKLGRTLADTHAPVPDLNPRLGPALDTLLARLTPGACWFRANWGLSASDEWNQHPDRHLRPLRSSDDFASAVLRVEHQALQALPHAQGVLFAIRIEHHPLATWAPAHPDLARSLARALRSMPEAMAHYKGLTQVRAEFAQLLTPATAG